MRVKILKVETSELADGYIKEGKGLKLPSIHDKWRFNFSRHAKAKGANAYVLIADETPAAIEGCLIYKMREEQEPYMAYVEIAPHNRGKKRKYDLVAGCLIAFACRLSFELGKTHFKGWLAFDVQEPTKEDEKKLMELYSKDYGAVRFAGTTMMLIKPENGEKLIERYLQN
ncbi:MAG TPA: hypothetical protein VK476_06410 [Flavobacterium sp.]|nr:hypothetical protein [Flavobacterium sp.]